MSTYAGIGSRTTPNNIQDIFTKIARRLEANGYTLRSGGAGGADTAFEAGVTSAKEIYLPWPKFNNNPSPLCYISKEAMDLAKKYHPNWTALSPAAKKLMARNSYQVLGEDLNSPSKFIICYTPNGSGSGGTGQAIRIAKDCNIPIVDFGKNTIEANLEEIKSLLSRRTAL